MHILAGLERTLQSCKPEIIMEVGDLDIPGASSSRTVDRALFRFGYAPFEVREGRIVGHAVQDKYEYGNLLFIHVDQHS